jgi:shikimate kinase
LIEKKLQPYLKSFGYTGINDVSRWMGQPYESRYKKNSQLYLKKEKEVLDNIIEKLETVHKNQNIVIDTTGSLIYINKESLKKLAKLTTVVYICLTKSIKQQMFQVYINDPKPVFWGQLFNKKSEESDIEALRRCYPLFLEYRTKQYERLAVVTIPHYLVNGRLTVEKIISLIKK